MTEPLTIKDLQTLCFMVQCYFPNANIVIAGGAPRDILNNRPVKDIDVFMRLDSDEEFHSGLETASAVFGKEVGPVGGEDYGMLGLFEVRELKEAFNGYTVQFIRVTKDPETVVRYNCDLSICEVWVTGDTVNTTPDYDFAVRNKCFKYTVDPTRTRWQIAATRRHIARLQIKYPEFSVQGTLNLGLETFLRVKWRWVKHKISSIFSRTKHALYPT